MGTFNLIAVFMYHTVVIIIDCVEWDLNISCIFSSCIQNAIFMQNKKRKKKTWCYLAYKSLITWTGILNMIENSGVVASLYNFI